MSDVDPQQQELPMDLPELIGGEANEPDWRALHLTAGRVFRPTTPVDVLDVFTGRSREIARICDVVVQDGQHAILFGERGVGKTSLANVLSEYLHLADPEQEARTPVVSPRVNCETDDNFDRIWRKVFRRIQLNRSSQGVGFQGQAESQLFGAGELLPPDYQVAGKDARDVTPDVVMHVLSRIGSQSVFIIVIDEFDRLGETTRVAFADLVKMLSDHAIPATVVMVGVADTIDGLLEDHESISRAIVQVHMERMPENEIQQVLKAGTGKLGMAVTPEAVQRVSAIAQGLPHYAHLLGLNAVRAALKARTLLVGVEHVRVAVEAAVRDTHHSTVTAYHEAVRSAQKNTLFADVLLACALARCDPLGYFAPKSVCAPLRRITGKADYDIANFATHLSEFISEKRGRILQRTGVERSYRYRFRDPLMQPFVIMQGELSERLPAEFFVN